MTLAIKPKQPLFLWVVLFFFLSGCIQSPVEEEVTLHFFPDRVEISQETNINDDGNQDNASLNRRLQRLRRDLDSQRDGWSVMAKRLKADEETLTLKKYSGQLQAVERTMKLADPLKICDWFSLTDVTCTINQDSDWLELTLFPNTSTRASRSQENRIKKILDGFTASFSQYLDQLDQVLAHMEDHPDRKLPVLGVLLAAENSDEKMLTDLESNLLILLQDRKAGVLAWLNPGANGYTPAEEVSLVFDSFPAPTNIQVTGEILQQEGFLSGPAGKLQVRRPGLVWAIEQLDTQWLSPAPLARELKAALGNDQPTALDVEDLMGLAIKRTELPGETGVREQLNHYLTHPPLYRLRWINDEEMQEVAEGTP